VNGLHQATNGFLEQVGIAEGVMAKSLGDVSGQADIGGSQPMFEMDVPVVQTADSRLTPGLAVAVIADKLSHGPGLERRTMRPHSREMTNQSPHQFRLALPKVREQFAFFFGRKEVRREDGGGRNGNSIPGRRLALSTLSLHNRPSQSASVVG